MTDLRIQIVEDEPVTGAVAEKLLASLGHHVVAVAATALDALDKARVHLPDLILMDIRLSDRPDGIEAAREIYGQLGVPVVLMTGTEEVSSLDNEYAPSVLGIVFKPLQLAQVNSVIQMAYARHKDSLKLAQSERRLRAIIDHSSDAIIIVDSDGIIIDTNTQAEKTFDLPREDISGRLAVDLFYQLMPEGQQRETVQTTLKEIFSGKTSSSPRSDTPFQFGIVRKSGGERTVECASFGFAEGGSRFTGLLIRNISERIASEMSERIAREIYRIIARNRQEHILIREILNYGKAVLSSTQAAAFLVGRNAPCTVLNEGFGDDATLRMSVELTNKAEAILSNQGTTVVRQLLASEASRVVHPVLRDDGSLVIFVFDISEFQPDAGALERALDTTAETIGQALGRLRAEGAAAQRLEEVAALHSVSILVNGSLDLSTVLEGVLRRTAEFSGCEAGALFLHDENDELLHLETAFGFSPAVLSEVSVLRRGEGVTGRSAEAGVPLAVEDIHASAATNSVHLVAEGWRSLVSVPIIRDERVLAVMTLGSTTSLDLNDDLLRFLQAVGNQVGAAVANACLYREKLEMNRRLEEMVDARTAGLRLVYEFARSVGGMLEPRGLFELVDQTLGKAMTVQSLFLLVADPIDPRILTLGAGRMSAQRYEETVSSIFEAFNSVSWSRILRSKIRCEQLDGRLAQRRRHGDQGEQAPRHRHQSVLYSGNRPVGYFLAECTRNEGLEETHQIIFDTLSQQVGESLDRLLQFRVEKRRRIEGIIEEVPDGVVLLDSSGRLITANSAGSQALSEALEPYLKGAPLQAGVQVGEILNRFSADATRKLIELDSDFGNIFELHQKLIQNGPESGGRVIIIRNVTTQRTLQVAESRRERLASVGQLAAGVAHDFNNILTGILSYAQFIQTDPPDRTRVVSVAQSIVEQAQRAAGLVEQILDFSRGNAREMSLISVEPFLKELLRFLKQPFPPEIDIDFAGPATHSTIMGNPVKLQQIFTNLVMNARDAITGAGRITITVDRDARNGWVVISVGDDGCGIPSQDIPHIFDPFFTTKEPGAGTGLGLSQVYGLAEDHGGFVAVESTPAVGSTFYLWLPLSEEARSDSEAFEAAGVKGGQKEISARGSWNRVANLEVR